MKHIHSAFCVIPLLGSVLSAQVPTTPPPPPPTEVVTAPAPALTAPAMFTADQLDQLLGPIALYPDALVAIILPASTYPSDVVLAARFLDAGGAPSQVELQPWEDSVRALANYPQLVRWMDQNLAWTKQVGDAFAAQPADVMTAIQRLRERARAAGTLTNTPEQEVIVENNAIVIVPADPNIIYIPYYDPTVVYGPASLYYPYSTATYFSFSAGFSTGWWLCYGFDWHNRRVWAVNHEEREHFWREHQRDWHRYTPPFVDHPRDVHVWHPHNDRRGPLPNYKPEFGNRPAPGFDRRREGPRPDHDYNGRGRPWRQSVTTETALATPRAVGPTVGERARQTPAARLPEAPALNVRPTPNPASVARPGATLGRTENKPGFPPRSYTAPATNTPAPAYVPPQRFAPPPPSAPVMPRVSPWRPAPAPRYEAPRYEAPRSAPAPAAHYTPPPAPAPQQQPAPPPSANNNRQHGWDHER